MEEAELQSNRTMRVPNSHVVCPVVSPHKPWSSLRTYRAVVVDRGGIVTAVSPRRWGLFPQSRSSGPPVHLTGPGPRQFILKHAKENLFFTLSLYTWKIIYIHVCWKDLNKRIEFKVFWSTRSTFKYKTKENSHRWSLHMMMSYRSSIITVPIETDKQQQQHTCRSPFSLFDIPCGMSALWLGILMSKRRDEEETPN